MEASWEWSSLLPKESFSLLTRGWGSTAPSWPQFPGGLAPQLPQDSVLRPSHPRGGGGGASPSSLSPAPRTFQHTLTLRLGKDTAHINTRPGNQKYATEFKLLLRLFSSVSKN